MADETTSKTGRHRARRGEGGELRGRIVEAATVLLAEAGDDQAVSIRAVCEAVGITPPSLYMHFTDKSALLSAVLERLFVDLEREIYTAQEASEGAAERVINLARAYITYGMKEPGRYKILYEGRLIPALSLPDGGIPGRALLESAIRDLAAAVAAKEVADADPRQTAIRLWQFLHGVVSLRINKPNFPWTDAWHDAAPGVAALIAQQTGPTPHPSDETKPSRGNGHRKEPPAPAL